MDIYQKFHIDKTKLKRDYIKHPLKKVSIPIKGGFEYEFPYKEDLEYLISLPISYDDIAYYFNICIKTLRMFRNKLGLKRDNKISYRLKELSFEEKNNISYKKYIQEQIKKTNLERYGVETILKYEPCKQKIKNTMKERYNSEYFLGTKICLEKTKKTNLNKRNVEWSMQDLDVRKKSASKKHLLYGDINYTNKEKARRTCQKKYEKDYYSQTDEYKQRVKKTNLEKYGLDSYSQTDEYKQKIKKTNLEKYGVENYSQTDEFKQRVKNTCLKKYGVGSYLETNKIRDLWKNKDFIKQIKEKEYWTKKQRNSFLSRTSKEELYILGLLKSKFPNVIHQYRDKDRYPFNCDFYIPELDLFVEYQGYISHGPQKYHCPFDSNNDEHRKIVDEWFKKSEEYNFKGQKKKKYLEYIKCWTISDVIKRETAKENNLNYLEFFDIHQFMDWFMTQGVKENEDTYLEHRD